VGGRVVVIIHVKIKKEERKERQEREWVGGRMEKEWL
jgi:hypothetical protein